MIDDRASDPEAGPVMNRAGYDRIAGRWDGARGPLRPAEEALLERALAGLSAGDPVLDLGCGTGWPIGQLLHDRGLAVTGIDQSTGMLAIAQARLPSARFVAARIEDYRPEPGLAAILCWDALFHVPRVHHATLLKRWAACLRPGGRLVLTYGGSAHPAFVDTMFDTPFFYDAWPPDVLQDMAIAAGFTPIAQTWLDRPDGGRDKGRIGVVFEAQAGSRETAW